MTSYHRLTFEEREEISRLLAQKYSFQEIAHCLGRNVSTISNEVNSGGCNRYTYRAGRAHRRAIRNAAKRKRGKKKIILNKKLHEYTNEKLNLKWSPEQIAKTLKREYPNNKDMRIWPETIYSYLYTLSKGQLKQELLKCLRQKRKRRRKRRNLENVAEKRKIEDMLSIEERPKEIEDRIIPGHWEGDLIVGRNRQSYMGTLVERTTRFTILVKLKNKKAKHVREEFAKAIKNIPNYIRLSLTYDQGREMAEHELFTKDTQVIIYFAHPASPWERGTNENTNMLIRQFFPKGTSLNKIPLQEILKVQDLLNSRPRKTLQWYTPYEKFNELLR